jgi:hypothetical protein
MRPLSRGRHGGIGAGGEVGMAAKENSHDRILAAAFEACAERSAAVRSWSEPFSARLGRPTSAAKLPAKSSRSRERNQRAPNLTSARPWASSR